MAYQPAQPDGGRRVTLILPSNVARIVNVVRVKGKTYANVVLKDGTPKTIKQPSNAARIANVVLKDDT